jgi:predicted nuclease with TOPRIM domain
MFRTKLDYLYKENIELRKEISVLRNMLAEHSAENEKSMIYQLREENERLHERVSNMSDKVRLWRFSYYWRRKLGR